MVRCTLPRKYFGIDFTYGGSFAIRYSGDFTADEIYMTLSFLASQSPEAFVDACERCECETTAEWAARIGAGSRPVDGPKGGGEL